jgi:hypothetical protein
MNRLVEFLKTTEFSKKIAVVIILLYLLVIGLGIIFYLKFDKNIGFVIDYVQSALMVILISYFTKSGAENVMKIVNGKVQVNNENQNNNETI